MMKVNRITVQREWVSFVLLVVFLITFTAAALHQSGGMAFLRSDTTSAYHTIYVQIPKSLLVTVAILLLFGVVMTAESVHYHYGFSTFLHPVLFLIGVGMVFQAFVARGELGYAKHALNLAVGLLVLCGATVIGAFSPGRKTCSLLCYGILALVAANLIYALFHEPINGSWAWIRFHGLSFQPGELEKVGLLMAAAWGIPYLESEKKYFILYTATSAAVSIGLLVINDYGNAFITAILLTMILLRYRPRWVWIELPAAAVLTVISYMHSLKIKSRVGLAFQVMAHPDNEKYWQIRRVLLGVVRGGMSGTGVADGAYTPSTYIANAQDDFSFLTMTAVFGVWMAALVIGAFLSMAVRSTRTAAEPHQTLLRILVSSALILQALIHVGGTLNVLPFTGCTFPFLSSGGTSIVCCSAMSGILLSTCLPRKAGQRIRHQITDIIEDIQDLSPFAERYDDDEYDDFDMLDNMEVE